MSDVSAIGVVASSSSAAAESQEQLEQATKLRSHIRSNDEILKERQQKKIDMVCSSTTAADKTLQEIANTLEQRNGLGWSAVLFMFSKMNNDDIETMIKVTRVQSAIRDSKWAGELCGYLLNRLSKTSKHTRKWRRLILNPSSHPLFKLLCLFKNLNIWWFLVTELVSRAKEEEGQDDEFMIQWRAHLPWSLLTRQLFEEFLSAQKVCEWLVFVGLIDEDNCIAFSRRQEFMSKVCSVYVDVPYLTRTFSSVFEEAAAVEEAERLAKKQEDEDIENRAAARMIAEQEEKQRQIDAKTLIPRKMKVTGAPNGVAFLDDVVFLNPNDTLSAQLANISQFVRVNEQHIHFVCLHHSIEQGSIGFNRIQRQGYNFSIGSTVIIRQLTVSELNARVSTIEKLSLTLYSNHNQIIDHGDKTNYIASVVNRITSATKLSRDNRQTIIWTEGKHALYDSNGSWLELTSPLPEQNKAYTVNGRTWIEVVIAPR